jgi:hypothetical protein
MNKTISQGLIYAGISGLLLPLAAIARPIPAPNAETLALQQESACYLKTLSGTTIDLTHLCAPRPNPRNSRVTSAIPANPTTANPNFTPIPGANPGNPFGQSPGKCYIVDSDGNPCE